MKNILESKYFSLSGALVVFRREFMNYFNTPIGYIFLGIFSILMNFLFFQINRYWETGRNMRGFFDMLRITYIFFIPAITMRLWAEEKRSGTVELIFTLPLRDLEIIIGKYLSALAFLGIALLSTMFLVVTTTYSANPDMMTTIGAYIGAFFMGSAYIALGLLISWLTTDQIVAFIVSVASFFFLFFMSYQPILQVMGPFKEIVAYLSISWHYDSLARGLFDTRDLLYFVLFSALCIYLNKRSIDNRR